MLLGTIFILIAWNMGDLTLRMNGIVFKWEFLQQIDDGFFLLYGPIIYFYAQGVIYRDFKLSGRNLLHLIPFLLLTILLLSSRNLTPGTSEEIIEKKLPWQFYLIGALLYDATPEGWATNTVKTWNSGLLPAAGSSPDFYVVHNYYTNYQTNANAAEILATPQSVTKKMSDYVNQSVTGSAQTPKPIALDEYNIFSQGSKQAVSHINGLHAVMVLGESLRNNFGLAARWDLANGWDNGNDHGMFNNGDEPDGVPKWNPRPAFYHMYFMQRFFGDRLVASFSTDTDAVSYATSFSSGEMGVVLINKNAGSKVVEVKVNNFSMGSRCLWYTLTGSNDNGEFSRKTLVNGVGPTFASGGPANYQTIAANAAQTSGGIRVEVPARSAVYMVIEKK